MVKVKSIVRKRELINGLLGEIRFCSIDSCEWFFGKVITSKACTKANYMSFCELKELKPTLKLAQESS